MTDWDASGYGRISGLQQAMAAEVLALLDLKGSERVLDVGCGNGKVTAEIASRIPEGSVVGVDSSADMIGSARHEFGPGALPNLRFEVADARQFVVSPRIRSGGLVQRPPLGAGARASAPFNTLCPKVRGQGTTPSGSQQESARAWKM